MRYDYLGCRRIDVVKGEEFQGRRTKDFSDDKPLKGGMKTEKKETGKETVSKQVRNLIQRRVRK